MVKITKQQVERIAKLAGLELKKREVEKFGKELSEILDYFNLLKNINVSGLKPTFQPAESFFSEEINIMREDEVKSQDEEKVAKMIEAAPAKQGRHIKVSPIRKVETF